MDETICVERTRPVQQHHSRKDVAEWEPGVHRHLGRRQEHGSVPKVVQRKDREQVRDAAHDHKEDLETYREHAEESVLEHADRRGCVRDRLQDFEAEEARHRPPVVGRDPDDEP